MKMPRNIGPVHFIGIGGIGMSGIAEILHNQNYAVRGSDSALNPNVQRLQAMGIPVEVGQKGENLRTCGPALSPDPGLRQSRNRRKDEQSMQHLRWSASCLTD